MTDRIHSLTVALEHDIREDDIEPLVSAISMLRCVLSVEQHITSPSTWTAEERAKHEIGQKLLDVIYPDRRKS